jgi:NADH-quinone oxidoreductase subunit L
MGGLARAIPFTWAMMLIGNLALTGVGVPVLHVGMAGFYSKDSIIDAAYESTSSMGGYAFTLTAVAALFTSFYSWRQFLMTFHGRYRGADEIKLGRGDADAHAHGESVSDHGHGDALEYSAIHESPLTMLVPLAVLALGAVVAGFAFDRFFIGPDSKGFWHGSLGAIAGNGLAPQLEHFPDWVEILPMALTAFGFGIAYYYYILNPGLPAKLAAQRGLVYTFLYNKWYFDELYDFLFVRPAQWIGRQLWKIGDGAIIDGLGPDGIAARVLDATRGAVRLQSGYVYHYAFAMLIGVVALATWFIVRGSGL